ncbi:MAG: YgiQ family radical SAM protein [Candidatus Cloacimonetes bacterium]|nr:YgiQ family radical SAM protein [Candidatus Cloacimonadota bacterium]MCF7813365.1 YgiQ family radical SAM protein [Candidatus Cloacimonadota bacterium]MCF7867510.1 YgiQ family radical SAM protein [Candidatus Cloacimonadota bacterium]MCF7882988.1 YgiQ family radical SAM protein [Candidatus Cloacimonadota bacterium]
MSYFLPATKEELTRLGWKQLDIIIITGDAYVDHPSFGPILIARYLHSKGFKVGIISQPDWKSDKDFTKLGKPRLFFGVSSGNMDSMVNHYTAQRKIRSNDAYSPDGKMGLRPNRATIVYSQKLRSIYKETPIILGGIEASLRRLPHYDFWSDKVRNSILFDSRADMLVYGMGEMPILEIAERLNNGHRIDELKEIRGTVTSTKKDLGEISFGEFKGQLTKKEFWELYQKFYENNTRKVLSYKFAGKYLLHNKPASPLSKKEIDEIYDLPFIRKPHPMYGKSKNPAFVQIKDSITSHRGCFGGCSFCAIGFHQGKTIQSRSKKSIVSEAKKISNDNEFKGTISDIGGPSANMYGMYCKLDISEICKRNSCLFPQICENLNSSHDQYANVLKECLELNKVNNVYVSSGIRFDLALEDSKFIERISDNHVQGLLKLAPEHKSSKVLDLMNKATFELYEKFGKLFRIYNKKIGKKQFIVPYIIIGHPGETFEDILELAVYLKKNNIKLKQIQEFTPTPMSLSTTMYYTEMDMEGRNIDIPRGRKIRLRKALVQWFEPSNKKYIIEILRKYDRNDLIDNFLK